MKSLAVVNLLFIIFNLASCGYIYDYIQYEDLGIEYKMHPKPATWLEALETCNEEYAKLAMPRNVKETAALVSIFDNLFLTSREHKNNKFIHLSFHDRYVENYWITLDDESITELKHFWNGNIRYRCGGMDYSGAFTDVDCESYKYLFICQRRYKKIRPHYNPAIAYPLRLTNSRKEYKIHSDPKKFIEAREICHSEGAHLAIFKTNEEYEFIKKELKVTVANTHKIYGAAKCYAYIGIHDFFKENEFMSVMGDFMSDFYLTWVHGKPTKNKNKNCVVISTNGNGYEDEDCEKKFYFVCEREVPITNSTQIMIGN